MPMHRWMTLPLLVLPLGCGAPQTGTVDETATETEVGCSTDPRGLSPLAGASVASLDGTVRVTVESVDPAVPARGNNFWVVQVADGAGAPLEGATISIQPFMPDHGHGSPSPASAEPLGGGRYQLSPLNFSMPGLWELRLGITPAGGARVAVTLGTCVIG